MIREDILQKFPELFGTKKVNGRDINVEADHCRAHQRAASRYRCGPNRSSSAAAVRRAGHQEIRVAEAGTRHLRIR